MPGPSTQPSKPFQLDPPAAPRLTLEELTSQSIDSTLAAARELLLEYGRFVAAQAGVANFCYGALEEEATTLPQSYIAQRGGAIMACVDRQPAGFVAWRSLTNPALDHALELKRLWIRPNARGVGAGNALVQAIIDRALAAGKTTLLLDTEPKSMASAHRLYLQMGFTECPPYNGPGSPEIIYLSKTL